MEITYKNIDDTVIACLSGELDEFTAEHVRLSLDTILKDKVPKNVEKMF